MFYTGKRNIQQTADGSVTIYLEGIDENYHSKHGAIQEAQHVFIKNGLIHAKKEKLSILEIGFGTGLNAFLTLIEATKNNRQIKYTGVEAYPISSEEIQALNFVEVLNASAFLNDFNAIHQCCWEEENAINPHFSLLKKQLRFEDIKDENLYDLIYFDAFGFRVQPELWSEDIFKRMYKALKHGGVLVTYACRTPIKKAMETARFVTEKLVGPPGKREMLRAIKL